MPLTDAQRRTLRCLILKALDGRIDPAEGRQLNEMLTTYPDASEVYLDLVRLSGLLHGMAPLRSVGPTAPVASEAPFDAGMWHVLAAEERSAPTLKITPPAETPIVRPPAPRGRLPRLWPRVAAVAAVLLAGVILAGLWTRPRPVCRVVAVTEGHWGTPGGPLAGATLCDRDPPRTLLDGVLQLQFSDRTTVILEAPVTFACPGPSRLALYGGRVCARMSGGTRGFTIGTPGARVVDLGTEFGVRVLDEGDSIVQVYEGQTSVSPANGLGRDAKLLTAGQARRVLGRTGTVTHEPFLREAFIRYVSPDGTMSWRGQSLDLADVVGGGRGLGGGVLNRGIASRTGRSGQFEQGFHHVPGVADLQPVPDNPLVNAVFVPQGPNQPVSTAGHRFADCPSTTGVQWGPDEAGGVIINGAWHAGYAPIPRHHFVLDGQTYGTGTRSALCMHANLGITFDLAAMRRSLPDLHLTRFRARCGLSHTLLDYTDARTNPPSADFFVLLDGRTVFARRGQRPQDAGQAIDVALPSDARFLTLVTADAGACDRDWTFFAEPEIELARETEMPRVSPTP